MDNIVQVKILDPRASGFGQRSTEMSAAYDLYACIENPMSVRHGAEATMVPTGIAAFMNDKDIACLILPRSGLAHKQGLVLGNSVGLVDADYQNQWFISVWNRGQQDEIIIHPGDRIAQALFIPVIHPTFRHVHEFSESTGRGLGGFGSTGVSKEASL